MDRNLSGKNILIVQGSLLAGPELEDAFARSGARVYLTGNTISAYDLLRRVSFEGAVIDKGLHNEAFDLCRELQALGIPYQCCSSPHRLHRASARQRDAERVVLELENRIATGADSALEGIPAVWQSARIDGGPASKSA